MSAIIVGKVTEPTIELQKQLISYLYEKGESYNYRCHRCDARSSLKTILKELNPKLYLQYVTEKFQDIFTPTIEYSPEHKRITKT